MREKLTFEFVRDFFLQKNCVLLEDHYKDAKTKMQYQCECGGRSLINWNNFQQGQRCRECSFKKTAKSRKLNQDDVEKCFEKRGCKLLSEYVNSQTKIEYECFCGARCVTYYHSFKKGNGCANCKSIKLSGPNNCNWILDRNKVAENKLFRKKCYAMIHNSLSAFCMNKNSKTYKLLGYTAKELLDHIHRHENWKEIEDNKLKWDLDHIFPIKAFVDHGISDLSLINCLENLRPMSMADNRSKNCKYNKGEFETWLQSK